MAGEVVEIIHIQARAQRDCAAGRSIEQNPVPWHSAAYGTWHAEFVRLMAERTEAIATEA